MSTESVVMSWGRITHAEVLAKSRLRIRAQYGEFHKLQITFTFSRVSVYQTSKYNSGADAGKMQTCLRGYRVESIKFSSHAPLEASNVFEPHIFQTFFNNFSRLCVKRAVAWYENFDIQCLLSICNGSYFYRFIHNARIYNDKNNNTNISTGLKLQQIAVFNACPAVLI